MEKLKLEDFEKRFPSYKEKPYVIPENSCTYCVHGQPNSRNRKCLSCHDRSEFKKYNQCAQEASAHGNSEEAP